MKVTVEYQSKGKTIKVEVDCDGVEPNVCTDKVLNAVKAMERIYPPDPVPAPKPEVESENKTERE